MTWAIAGFALVCLFIAGNCNAAYISEIDLGGPAGQGIEFSGVDPTQDYTLLILNANPYTPGGFGTVLDVIHLPAGIGLVNVAMVTDLAWPDSTAATTPLASLTHASSSTSLILSQARLLVVMQGQSDAQLLDNPLGSDLDAQSRYDPTAVTDWLVLGHGDIGSLYAANGHDLDAINAGLGIDLLKRLIDKDGNRIIARANLPGTAIDMDTFYAGVPNDAQQFDVPGGYRYTYTPSRSNLSLSQVPEPSTLGVLAAAGLLCLRRRR